MIAFDWFQSNTIEALSAIKPIELVLFSSFRLIAIRLDAAIEIQSFDDERLGPAYFGNNYSDTLGYFDNFHREIPDILLQRLGGRALATERSFCCNCPKPIQRRCQTYHTNHIHSPFLCQLGV